MKEVITKKIQEEIKKLKYELDVELPEEIGRARELGDLKENAEYHAAKDRQMFCRARLEQLRENLGRLNMLDFSRIPRDRIGLGSTVQLLDLNTDQEVTYELVMAEEADASVNKISAGSPIGRSLINKQDGDDVEVRVPSGVREFEVLSFTTIYDKITDKPDKMK